MDSSLCKVVPFLLSHILIVYSQYYANDFGSPPEYTDGDIKWKNCKSYLPQYPVGVAYDMGRIGDFPFYIGEDYTMGRSTADEYSNDVEVYYDFIGSTTVDCTVEISCTPGYVKPTENCTEAFIEISDGVGGRKMMCGEIEFPKNIKASQGLKDLYFRAKGVNSRFQCTARCGGEDAVPLVLEVEQLVSKNHVCGVAPEKHLDENQLGTVGNDNVTLHEFPWLAVLVFKDTRESHCVGSLINDEYILTAAHCLEHYSFYQFEILLNAFVLGEKIDSSDPLIRSDNSTTATDESGEIYRLKIIDAIVHPLFNPEARVYDVALLRLAERIDFSIMKDIVPACLPLPMSKRSNYKNETAILTGWKQGSIENKRLLQKLDVPVIQSEDCENIGRDTVRGHHLSTRMLCAGNVKRGNHTCQENSGGPLIIKQDGGWFKQIGVVAWGVDCISSKIPGIYSDIHDMIQWIYKSTAGSTWCKIPDEMKNPDQNLSPDQTNNQPGINGTNNNNMVVIPVPPCCNMSVCLNAKQGLHV